MPVEYDPVKDRLQAILGRNPLARKLFFAVLDRLFLRARYVRREISRLKASGFGPLRILDAGSGFGQYSFRLARLFPNARVVGLDVKTDLVDSGNDFVQRAGLSPPDRIQFVVGDLLNLPYDSQFDLVLSVDVMEHIENDLLVFANIARALRPGGLFALTTPYYDCGSQAAEVADMPFVGEHVRPGYSKPELEEKLKQAGLELQKFIITYGPYGAIAWKLLQKWPMSWLSRRIRLAPLVAVYFCFAYPVAWIFMYLDMATHNRSGGGILAVAKRT